MTFYDPDIGFGQRWLEVETGTVYQIVGWTQHSLKGYLSFNLRLVEGDISMTYVHHGPLEWPHWVHITPPPRPLYPYEDS